MITKIAMDYPKLDFSYYFEVIGLSSSQIQEWTRSFIEYHGEQLTVETAQTTIQFNLLLNLAF